MESTIEKRFILIDGNALLHRAFHALPPLTSKKGEIVNAVYGFFSMFLKIIEDVKPTHIAVCFDRPKPTFRKTLYVGYQAKRPKMDGELVPQIGLVHEILQKGKIQIFEIDGYEADDLIGTLAKQAVNGAEVANKNFRGCERAKILSLHKQVPASQTSKNFISSPRHNLEVIIVSGDRDLLQLVNSHVKVLTPVVGITNMILYDNQKVEEKYGIKPTQIIDYKALVGDSSDNYPGVSGIGPKTAKELLQKFGSLEEIYNYLNRFGSLPHVVNDTRRALGDNSNFSSSSLSERRSSKSVKKSDISDGSTFSSFASGETSSSGSGEIINVKSPRDIKAEENDQASSQKGAIPPNIAEKLSMDAEQAALCKKLATIITDAPITLDIDKCFVEKINKEGIRESFEELGFKSLLKRLGEQNEVKKTKSKNSSQLGLL